MGEALHVLIPLPVPASVYGLVIMLIALGTHIIRLEQFLDTSLLQSWLQHVVLV